MDKLIIEGGVPLKGEIHLDGAKNASLPALAASLLAEEGWVILENVPAVVDIRTMCKFLTHMGAALEVQGSTIRIMSRELTRLEAPYELVKTMRASVLLMGPLLARYGYAKVSFPGGCAIGARPIDLHLAGFQAMGARTHLHEGYIEVSAQKLTGADLRLNLPTVTGTENLMMAAALAQGRTRIQNAAREPEIADLAKLLNAMGARISGAGTEIVEIEGVSRLSGARHQVITDRIEAATYAAAAAITHGELFLRHACQEHLAAVTNKMTEAGVRFESLPGGLTVTATERLRGVNVETAPYPGFPTDAQAQFMAMMCLSEGQSEILESVFENRFMHVAELRRMGADIEQKNSVALIKGVQSLEGAPVMATDLRASASLVLAGLAAKGMTQIARIYHLDRGYHAIEEKLAGVGARIRRVKA